LNQRRFAALPDFVADELVYNETPMTAGQYRQLLEDDVRTIPDLFFDVQQLVVDAGHVACRIRFDCTPVEPPRSSSSGLRIQRITSRLRRARLLSIPERPHRSGVVPARHRSAPPAAVPLARLT
jgi:SnoaL-like polyketide cyclase